MYLLKVVGVRTVLTTESFYLPEIACAKKLNRKLRVVDFCQELNLVNETPQNAAARFYARYAHIADLTIDVEPHRAQIRKEAVGLKELPLVLLNTVPMDYVTFDGSLSQLAGIDLPKDSPIVLYAGGISTEKPFSRIVSAVSRQKGNCFLLAFCATEPTLLDDARRLAAEQLPAGTFCIHTGVPHKELLAAMHGANVGIVDYASSIEKTSNQKFCAPTKMYEYLAAGLAVVGSANESLRCVIEASDAGVCALDDSDDALSEALNKVLSDHKTMQIRAREVFVRKYSYEKCCIPVIEKITEWLSVNI